MELIIWGSTLGFWAVSSTQLKPLFARSKAGKVKVGSTGPRVLTKLLIVGQIIGTGIPLVVYWAATAYNKFHQPEWLVKHALPPPPDVFGIDGMVVGRAVGLLGTITGMVLGKAAIKALGDQFLGIGVSTYLPPGNTGNRLTLLPCHGRLGRNLGLLIAALLRTSATPSTREISICLLSDCHLYHPPAQRELYRRGLFPASLLVVHSSLRTSNHCMRTPTQGAD